MEQALDDLRLELVAERDRLFTAFDGVVKRRELKKLKKLKTIGDASMAAAGIPRPRPGHAIAATLAALEIRDIVRAYTRDARARTRGLGTCRSCPCARR